MKKYPLTGSLSLIALIILLCLPSQVHAQPVISSWKTSTNKSMLFAPQSQVSFSENAGSSSIKITLNPEQKYQTIEGFGWTLTQGSAYWLMQMTSSERHAILQEIFSTSSGIGSEYVRVGIGATDLSSSTYTYWDNQNGQFSLAGPDLTYLIPVLQEIVGINPNIKIMGSPWSAPAWMKTNNSLINGSLKKEYFDEYALYFLNYLQAMEQYGIKIDALTVQNEPLNSTNNPSMTMTKEDQLDFVDHYLGPLLASNNFAHVKIIAYDHNCDNTEYPIYVCQSQYVEGSALHLYGGSISAMTTIHTQTGKSVYFTEQWTGGGGNFADDFKFHIMQVMIGSVNNWSRVALAWNLASNESYQPHTSGGGCTTCMGGITINSNTKTVTRNISYYTIAHLAKIARLGAYRISSYATSSDLYVSAFQNPDNTTSLVVFNNSGSARTFDIQWKGRNCTYSLEGNTCASLIWGEVQIDVPVTSVSVFPTSLTLKQYENAQLTATVLPQNASLKTVHWSSNNENVVTVDDNGLVKAKNQGTATITVITENEHKTAECIVTVTPGEQTGRFNGKQYIYSVYSNKVMDVRDLNLNAGAILQQWEININGEHHNLNQQWLLEFTGDETYRIQSVFSELWLQAMGSDNGSEIQLQPYIDNTNQQWHIEEQTEDNFSITNVYAGRSIDIEGPSKDNGAKLHLWGNYAGETNRLWRFVPVETEHIAQNTGNTQSYRIFPNPAHNTLNIDMPKQGRYKVSLYSSDARLIKRWLIMGADSSLDISNLFNGLYLVSIEDEHSIKFLNFIKQ